MDYFVCKFYWFATIKRFLAIKDSNYNISVASTPTGFQGPGDIASGAKVFGVRDALTMKPMLPRHRPLPIWLDTTTAPNLHNEGHGDGFCSTH